MDHSDHELLQRYGETGSQEAFAELVRRHLNLVYSAARRQVWPAELAEEVTQSVFVDLAKAAATFNSGTPVVAWLHVVTRRSAIDAMRFETRQKAREQIAVELASMDSSAADWSQLEPLLDEALENLNEDDRSALLLRYFENKSLREVGEAVGLSDDAAQKRVARALDKLRDFFTQRGIAVGTPGLLASFSANAIHAAPATLGLAISSTINALASTTLQQAATVHIAKTVAFTVAQKGFIALMAVAALGGGAFEGYQIYRQQREISALQYRADVLSATALKLRKEREDAVQKLSETEKQIDAALAQAANMQTGDTALVRAWLERVDRLKELVSRQEAGLAIPEMQFISDEVWLSVAQNAELDTDKHIRAALAQLRNDAENAAANKINRALKLYLSKNGGVLPDKPSQLADYFDPSVDTAFLDRYQMLKTGKYDDTSGRVVPVIAAKAPIDVEYDSYREIGVSGYTSSSALNRDLVEARKKYAKANGGQREADLSQLVPFLPWPVDIEVLRDFLHPPGQTDASSK